MGHTVLITLLTEVKKMLNIMQLLLTKQPTCLVNSKCLSHCVGLMLCCTHEDFVGMYEVHSASAKGLFELIKDVLLRFELNVLNLRGQGYDGCSVMAGRDNGVAARFKQLEPRAIFIHCSAHSMNLAVQEASGAVPMIRDCLSLVYDLAIF